MNAIKNWELVKTGRVFFATTGNAGVAVPVFSNTAQKFLLHNPKNSDVDVVVLQTMAGYVSGTTEAGHFCYGYRDNLQGGDMSAGTPLTTTVNALLGDGTGHHCDVYTTVTVPEALSYLAPIGWSIDASSAGLWNCVDNVDGKIVLQPGAILAVCADAVSTEFTTSALGAIWYEHPRN